MARLNNDESAKIGSPSLRLFGQGANGTDYLDTTLNVNGFKVDPDFFFQFKNTTSTELSSSGNSSVVVEATGSGDLYTFNLGAPTFTDASVRFPTSGQRLQSPIESTGDVDLEDFVLELFMKLGRPNAAGRSIIDKRDGLAAGYTGKNNNVDVPTLAFFFEDSGGSTPGVSAFPNEFEEWFHIMIFCDRDNTTSRLYLNGAEHGTFNPTGIPNSMSNTRRLTFGARTDLSTANDSDSIALAAFWKKEDWLEGSVPEEWEAIAKERFYKLCGIWPQLSKGQPMPIVATRSSMAVLDKVEVTGSDNLLSDGDMEAVGTAAWSALNNAILSKETDNPKEGSQYLRVTRNGTTSPIAQQNGIFTKGRFYRVTGWARSDGSAIPEVRNANGGTFWSGTNQHTNWQRVDFSTIVHNNRFWLVPVSTSDPEYCDFDDFKVQEIIRRPYKVGNRWLRMCRRLPASASFQGHSGGGAVFPVVYEGSPFDGYLSENVGYNFIEESENLSGSTWTHNTPDMYVSGNATEAPDGTQTAAIITEGASVTPKLHRVSNPTFLRQNGKYEASLWAKSINREGIRVSLGGTVKSAIFDLISGSVVSATSDILSGVFIEPWGNGWYRCGYSWINDLPANTSTNIEPTSGSLFDPDYPGGEVDAIALWGVMVISGTDGEFTGPHSYIYSSGSAGFSGSREEDNLQFQLTSGNLGDGNTKQGTTQGRILIDGFFTSSLERQIYHHFFNTNNKVRGIINDGGTNQIQFFARTDENSQEWNFGNASLDPNDGQLHSFKHVWGIDNAQSIYDGQPTNNPDVDCNVPPLNTLYVGRNNVDGTNFHGLLGDFEIFDKSDRDVELKPTFKFCQDGAESGLQNLDSNMTIGATTITASFVYEGKNATATEWSGSVYGGPLERVVVAGLNLGRPTPFTNNVDKAVGFIASDVYRAAENETGQIGTGDFVLECVFRHGGDGTFDGIMGNQGQPAGQWHLLTATTDVLRVSFNDETESTTIDANALERGAWYHVLVTVDRTGDADGVKIFGNGELIGQGTVPAGLTGSLTGDGSIPLDIGSRGNNSLRGRHEIAYAAMWQQDGWLSDSLQESQDLARERFYRACGIWPQLASGTFKPIEASRDSVAYVDVQNTIQNFISSSEDLSHSSWSSVRGHVTGTVARAPNGELDAMSFAETQNVSTGISQIQIDVPTDVSGTHYIISWYVKPKNRINLSSKVQYGAGDSPQSDYVLTGSDVKIIGTQAGHTPVRIRGIVSDVGGWYRCWMKYTSDGVASTFVVRSINDNGPSLGQSQSGSGEESFYLWGFQMEEAKFGQVYPSPYVETTGTPLVNSKNRRLHKVGENWLRVCKRVDLSGTIATGYLPETGSINFLSSSDFVAQWAPLRTFVSGYAEVSPTGEQDAAIIVEDDTAASTHDVRVNSFTPPFVSGTDYTFSVWAKSLSGSGIVRRAGIDMRFASWSEGISFNLVSGSLGAFTTGATITGSIEDWGDDWYRCIIKANAASTLSTIQIIITDDPDSGGGAIIDGLSQNSIALFGAQVEQAGYASSLMFSTASSTPERRNNDTLIFSGTANWPNVGSGSVAFKVLKNGHVRVGDDIPWYISSGSNSNPRIIAINDASKMRFLINPSTGSAAVIDHDKVVEDGLVKEYVATYESASAKFFFTGSQVAAEDTSVEVPTNLDRINLGHDHDPDQHFGGLLYDFKIFQKVKKQ